MRDKFTIYDHERWEPNPHWGRPLRFLTRSLDISEGKDTMHTAKAIIAGLNGFWPRPP